MSRTSLVLVLVTACSATPPGPPGTVQMNDVSILFPLTGAPSSYLTPSAAGRGGVLLPPQLYDAVEGIGSASPSEQRAAYADLRVVAMRLDPCFASLDPDPHGNGCTSQLRLVFQEVTATGGKTTAADSGLHVFYAISRDDLIAMVGQIQALREASAPGERLGGLAPHPIIVREGLDGPMAAGVRDAILQYAGAGEITRVTSFSLGNTNLWDFFAFDVADPLAPTVSFRSVPTIEPGLSPVFQRGDGMGADTSDTVDGEFAPVTSSADGFAPLANETTAAAMTSDARKAAFDGLVRVDHPAKNSPETIDCATCHLATPVSAMIAEPLYGLVERDDPDAFHADGTFVLPGEMTPTFLHGDRPFNLHAFSYVGADPAINQRTVNETAAIVRYLDAEGL
jgi:hypothetical protein